MATESPLFQSAMELLGHSISHFNGQDELDRKLVILHLANAIELILKDIVLDSGESIYKNPKETITVFGCIQKLKEKEIPIPFLNKIELLIDERNALQHRFGSPNELTTIFYMNIVTEFFKTILHAHYDQNFDEILAQFSTEKDLLAFRMREPSDESELENLMKLSVVHPLGALLSAIAYMERVQNEFVKKIGLDTDMRMRPTWGYISHRFLERYGICLPEDLRDELDEARRIRNYAAHGRKDPTQDDVKKVIIAVEKYESFLSSIDIKEASKIVEEELAKREDKRQKTLEKLESVAG